MAKSKTKKTDDLLELMKSRLTQAKKHSEKWRKQVKEWLADYNIESFDNIDFEDLHNQLQVPYIFSTIESGLPTMFEMMPSIIMTRGGKRDGEFTDFTQDVWNYVVEKINLEEKVEDVGIMMLITGLSQLRYGWKFRTKTVEEKEQVPLIDPDTKLPVLDEKNQPVTQELINKVDVVVEDRPTVEFYNYDRVHYSSESKFVMDDVENEIPYIICEKLLSPDQVKDIYGEDADDVEMIEIGGMEKQDEKSLEKDFVIKDLKRVHVYHYFGTLPKDEAPKEIEWSSDTVYKIPFISGKILKKEIEEVDKKPIVSVGNYGTPVDFHRFGEPKVLRELEQDVSLGRSIMADYRDRVASKVAIPHGTEVDEVAFKSPRKFQIVRFIGQQYPQYIAPPGIPEAVVVNTAQSRSDIQLASAQLDLSRGGTSSVVETATGQKIFEQATERRIARKRKKIGNFIKHLAKNILILCAENWNIEVFAKITDIPIEEIQQKGFIEKLKKLGEGYDIKIKVEDVSFNKEARKAQAIAMYKELKDQPLANQEELLKEAIKVGFDEDDVERFLSRNLSPEQMLIAIDQFTQMGFMTPEIAEQMKQAIMMQAQQAQTGQGVGRPGTQNPVDIVNKATPGSDVNQIQTQNAAAYKQVGVPK